MSRGEWLTVTSAKRTVPHVETLVLIHGTFRKILDAVHRRPGGWPRHRAPAVTSAPQGPSTDRRGRRVPRPPAIAAAAGARTPESARTAARPLPLDMTTQQVTRADRLGRHPPTPSPAVLGPPAHTSPSAPWSTRLRLRHHDTEGRLAVLPVSATPRPGNHPVKGELQRDTRTAVAPPRRKGESGLSGVWSGLSGYASRGHPSAGAGVKRLANPAHQARGRASALLVA